MNRITWNNISITQAVTALREETCVVSFLGNYEGDSWVVIGFNISACL